MKFADADVMTMGDGSIPPMEVRLDLQPGDRVGLYEEVRHPSMGAGYSPLEAIVLGSPEPGWFVGETEDGREITFHAGNVADVMMASPQMGGIFDWFKRLAPPSPGAMIPSEQAPPQLPALPPKPEERRGLIAQLKSLFAAPFAAKEQELAPTTEKRSIFDIFKKPPVPPGEAGLPVPRGEREVAPFEKKPSMFSVLDPGTKVVIPFAEKAAAMVLPEAPGPLAPYIEKALEPFVVIPKSPEPEPFEVRKARQQELWSGMFPKAEEGRPPLSEMFTMFKKEELQPPEEFVSKELPKTLHRNIKILPMPRRRTLLPSVEEVARGLMGFYNPIEEFWDAIREARSTPAWQKYVKQYGFAKEPFESLGNCGGPPDIFQELAAFMHIPWEEFRNRAEIEVDERTDTEEWVSDERVWEEIVFPSTELITQALDLMKPPDIPGHFIIEHDEDHGCMLLITYVEGEEKEGAREEWEEEQIKVQEEQEGQEERSVEEIAESLEESIKAEEATIVNLMTQLEKIAPGDKKMQAIAEELRDNLEESKASLRALTEELSSLPMPEEEPKRAPAKKKKAAKRGGKKKRK